MTLEAIPCRRENYGGPRTGPVSYLVVHYTAGDGDTARANGLYFSRSVVAASAHYFVDDGGVVASVPETHVAWHCGAASYRHPHCRNSNSLGVELCDTRADGSYGDYELDCLHSVRVVGSRHAVAACLCGHGHDGKGQCHRHRPRSFESVSHFCACALRRPFARRSVGLRLLRCGIG